MIKVGIFDVGGVLIESKLDIMYADIKKTLGISDQLFKLHYQPLIKELSVGLISETEFWHRLIERTECKGVLPQESLFKRIYYQNNYNVNSELLQFVDTLKSNGLKTVILSNTIESHAQLMREFNVSTNFDEVFLSNEIHIQKPDPEAYFYVLEKMQVKPEEAFFVDDLQENIAVAEKIGIKGILFTQTKSCIETIKKLM